MDHAVFGLDEEYEAPTIDEREPVRQPLIGITSGPKPVTTDDTATR